VIDPCCGSGHFLVVVFFMLLQMRMEEEGLDKAAAAEAVLRDNLFGLEIDPRCTQIAVFALALAAWKIGGYRVLPEMSIACSGIAVKGQLDEWLRLAGNDTRLRYSLEQLYGLFKDAPNLADVDVPPEYLAHHGRLVGLVPTVKSKLGKMVDQVGGFGTLLHFVFVYADNPQPWFKSMRLMSEEVMPHFAERTRNGVAAHA